MGSIVVIQAPGAPMAAVAACQVVMADVQVQESRNTGSAERDWRRITLQGRRTEAGGCHLEDYVSSKRPGSTRNITSVQSRQAVTDMYM